MVDTDMSYIVVMLLCLCPTVVGIETSRLSRSTDITEEEPENRIWPRFLTGGAACPDGWKHRNKSCYHVNQEKTTWTEAQKRCELHDSHLVYIESAQEQSVLETLLHHIYGYDVNADYWAGASDWNIEGKWVWEPNLKPLTYTNWFPGQPNNGRYSGHNIHEPGFDDQNCLLLRYNHSFQWIDTECSGHHFYVCELSAAHTHRRPTQTIIAPKPTTIPTSQMPTKTKSMISSSKTPTTTAQISSSTTPTTAACPDGWKQMNQSCYHVNQESTTWTEAQKMCELHDSHLVYIESAQEQSVLETLLHHIHGYDVNADYWAGASDWNIEGKWVWEPNLEPLTYKNWFPGQPNNGRYSGHNIHEPGFDDQNCLLLRYNHSFQWIDTECSGHHFYVCELPAARPTTTAATTTTTDIPTSKPATTTTRNIPTTTSRPTTTTTTTTKIPTTTGRPTTTTRTTTSTTSRPTTTTTRNIPTTTSRPTTTTRKISTATSRPTTRTTRKISTTTSRPTTTTTRNIPTTTSRPPPPPTTTRNMPTTTSRPTTTRKISTTNSIPTTTRKISTTTSRPTTRKISTTTSRPTTRKIPTTTSRPPPTTTRRTTTLTTSRPTTTTTTRKIPTTTSRPTTRRMTTTSTTSRPTTITKKIPKTTSRQTLTATTTTTTEKTFITEKHVSTSTQKTTTTEEEVVLIG